MIDASHHTATVVRNTTTLPLLPPRLCIISPLYKTLFYHNASPRYGSRESCSSIALFLLSIGARRRFPSYTGARPLTLRRKRGQKRCYLWHYILRFCSSGYASLPRPLSGRECALSGPVQIQTPTSIFIQTRYSFFPSISSLLIGTGPRTSCSIDLFSFGCS